MSGFKWPLHIAVQHGEIESVRESLNEYGLEKVEGFGYVVLRQSIILKHREITKLLLSRGARVNSKRSKLVPSDSPLHFAVQNGDIEIIAMLLDCGADIDARNGVNKTPLQYAISMGSEEIVDLLLDRGSNLNNITSPIYVAVENYLYKMTEKLLKLGACVNAIGNMREQFTPLHYAVKALGRRSTITKTMPIFSIVELLLSHGANANCKTSDGMTPMHFASEIGNLEVIKLLLNANADLNARANNTFTPLYFAVQNCHREAAKYLMDHGASIDAEFKSGETVLNLAVCKGQSMFVEDILKYSPNTNNASSKSCLKIAIKKSYSDTIDILLKYGFSVEPDDINDTVLLHQAIQMGYIQIIHDLIKYGLDLACNKEENCTILHIAVKYKRVEIAKLLLTNGADVNATDKAGKPALYYSTENSDVIMTKLLLSHGACVQKSPELLRVATKKVCKEMVEILLENSIDINASDKYGRTALHLTALNEYEGYLGSITMDDESDDEKIKKRGEIAKLLLSMGANVNAKTKTDGLTALHIACQKGFKNVVGVLLEYEADVNCIVKDCSPLQIAAQQGNALIIEMLIANGANVDSNRENGDTALHIVVRKGHEETLKILLKTGADVFSKNKTDNTPLHEASKQGNHTTVNILLQYGSPINWKNIDGYTPLHLAVNTLNFGVVKLLLDSGSDINSLTNNNYTAFDIALFSYRRSAREAEQVYDLYDEDECFAYDHRTNEFLDFKYETVCNILRYHVIMLKTVNFYVSEENLYFINRDKNSEEIILHKKNCEDEIQELKLEKIANNKLSLYDILTKNIHSLASYSRNKDVVKVFELDHYKLKFPIYAPIIEINFKKGTRRRLLLEEAQEFFKYYNELPFDCCDQILRYLSDSDLENIINVWKTPLIG